MQTLEIHVPESKSKLVKQLLTELGVTIKVKKNGKTPNKETMAAMTELKAGKGKSFSSVEQLFSSIE